MVTAPGQSKASRILGKRGHELHDWLLSSRYSKEMTGQKVAPKASTTTSPTRQWTGLARTSSVATCLPTVEELGQRTAGTAGGAITPVPCPDVYPDALPARSDRDGRRHHFLFRDRRHRIRAPASQICSGRPRCKDRRRSLHRAPVPERGPHRRDAPRNLPETPGPGREPVHGHRCTRIGIRGSRTDDHRKRNAPGTPPESRFDKRIVPAAARVTFSGAIERYQR